MTFQIAGYAVKSLLYEGSRSAIYRARREADGLAVILKTPRASFPTTDDLQRLRREFELGWAARRAAERGHLINCLEFRAVGGSVALVMEDSGGRSLETQFRDGAVGLTAFIDAAIAMAEALVSLHDASLVHRDIRPAHLLVHRDGVIRLCDLSTAAPGGRATRASPVRAGGGFEYLSPEQTGRTDWTIDQRSDLYSLGITLFRLLTGRLPFVGRDPLELLHRHLASVPPSPSDLRPDVPAPLAAIIVKLLAKNPDDRYQGARGLQADLARCRRQLSATGEIASFSLGGEDANARFALPERIYGREGESLALRNAFDKAAGGERVLVLVSGYPGVGKSALVEDITGHVQLGKGLFCAGKFDQLRRTLPYAALAGAVRALLQRILAGSSAEIDAWRDRLMPALGGNGRLLIDLVPELGLVIGRQPDVATLGPEQAQARFRNLVLSFVAAVATREHPLVIFIDDLQWADPASFSLLRDLLLDSAHSHLLIVGTYRDNEIAAAHPLFAFKEEVRRVRPIEQIDLQPLGQVHIDRLVADALGVAQLDGAPLAALVGKKTQGNPFFCRQFLAMLHTEGLLWFDRELGHWCWDLERCEQQAITRNVVDFLVSRIHRLSEEAQRVIRCASCMGGQFAVVTLAQVMGQSAWTIGPALAEIVANDLIKPVRPQADDASELTFLHDQVRQAAYLLISETERPPLHLTIGRLLLAAIPERERADRIFDIVDHFNLGAVRLDDPAERVAVARLNLVAGQRAKAANAYAAAATYLRNGLDLAGPNAWQDDYDLSLQLHHAYAEASFLSNALDEMERVCRLATEKARQLLDAVPAYELRIAAHAARSEMREALEVAREVLGALGVPVPRDPSALTAARAVGRTAWRMRGHTPATLLALPTMTDPAALAASRIIASVISSAYLVSPKLFPVLACAGMALTLRHGNCAWSTDTYLGWSAILIAGFGRIERGYQIGGVALEVMERLGAPAGRCRAVTVYNLLVRHWKEPLRDTVAPLRAAVSAGIEQGDVAYACVGAVTLIFNLLSSGHPLAEIEESALAYEALVRSLGQTRYLLDARRQLQLLRCLKGKGAEPRVIKGEIFDEHEALKTYVQHQDRAGLSALHYEKALLQFIHGELPAALDSCREAAAHVEALQGTAYPPALHFLSALVRLRSIRPGWGGLRQVKRSLRKLDGWASHAPANHAHRCHLLRAELARLGGRWREAVSEYERAIELAGRHGFIHEQAMALECAGRFHLAAGQERVGGVHLGAARDAWSAWGAAAKVRQLESEFGEVLARATASTATPTTTGVLRASYGEGGLDVASLMKASQAIAGEILLPRLVERLVQLATENTGARRGFLLLEDDGELRVAARTSLDEQQVAQTVVGGLEEPGERPPESLIGYVRRTLEPVVLADAASAGLFSHDPALVGRSPVSVLCAPLASQGKLAGVIYLENDRLRGAFTRDRLEVLNVLSGQAAIALDNARLYGELADAHREQVRISDAQARFVPREFLRILDRTSIVDVALGDNARKEVTVLLSDMRRFTTLVEGMSPQQHIGFINDYLGQMEPAIVEHGGFVDSYIGDAIVALFEGPVVAAVRAGVAMSSNLAVLNQHRARDGLPTIGMGIGLTTGLLTMGTIGGPTRIKCGVIGDPVNLAARIESLTKSYRTVLLVSDHTRDRLPDPMPFTLRLVDRVRVKGKTLPVSLFEVLDAEPAARRDAKLKTLSRFTEARALYFAGDFAAAARLFEECRWACPDDGAVEVHLARCRRFADFPPPDGWLGIEDVGEG